MLLAKFEPLKESTLILEGLSLRCRRTAALVKTYRVLEFESDSPLITFNLTQRLIANREIEETHYVRTGVRVHGVQTCMYHGCNVYHQSLGEHLMPPDFSHA